MRRGNTDTPEYLVNLVLERTWALVAVLLLFVVVVLFVVCFYHASSWFSCDSVQLDLKLVYVLLI